jgi:hypothetical protein
VTEILASPCQCPAAAALDRVETVCRGLDQRGYQPSYQQAARWIRAAINPDQETPA